MFDLTGKTAWVTGSGRNLGKAMVNGLASQGADIVVSNHTSTDELEETVSKLQSDYDVNVIGIQLDISDLNSVDEAISEIYEKIGRVDILVNNAAIRPKSEIEDLTLEKWNKVVGVNLTGAFLCTKAVFPKMKENEWGRIINISGGDAFKGTMNRLHVTGTSAGIIGFTRSLAKEGGDYNITSNCVVPGRFDTSRKEEQFDPNLKDPQRHREIRDEVKAQRTCLGRIGNPEDIAPLIAFLSSEGARYITGEYIHINGGLFPTVNMPKGDYSESLPLEYEL